ncbi:MAG: type I-C CRISPR-associated protein Cas8c/Csd1, partial [Lachnospiraceae bacterium]
LYTENPFLAVISLGAATPGRLAVTYYREMLGSDFLERLSHWYGTCAWGMSYKCTEDKKIKVFAPRPEDIAEAAYGTERSGKLFMDDKLKKETIERLLPCIIEGKKLPQDIVLAAFNNASNPIAFSRYNRAKIRDITCALIQKKWIDSGKREGVILGLDRNETDRDYLYGRLLAVADKMESDTYSNEEKGKRDTNVTRYMSMMKQNPAKTWSVILGKLAPYKKKLKNGLGIKYDKEFQEIGNLFTLETFTNTKSLGEGYWLGYTCEMADLWTKKENGGTTNE